MTDEQKAARNLETAGACGRTITRWWNGFYTGHIKPTVKQTAEMAPQDILAIIMTGSRREFKNWPA